MHARLEPIQALCAGPASLPRLFRLLWLSRATLAAPISDTQDPWNESWWDQSTNQKSALTDRFFWSKSFCGVLAESTGRRNWSVESSAILRRSTDSVIGCPARGICVNPEFRFAYFRVIAWTKELLNWPHRKRSKFLALAYFCLFTKLSASY